MNNNFPPNLGESERKKLSDVAGVQKFKKKIQEQAKERQSEAGEERYFCR